MRSKVTAVSYLRSGVIDFVEFLREFEAIFEMALTRVRSGAQGKLFDEK
jgi:hypothetical protein